MNDAGIRWPDGKRCAVLLSFDVDGPAVWVDDEPESWRLPRTFSMGSYGPQRAVPRLLDLLDGFGIPGTFFTPGWVAEQWPEMTRDIARSGHELGHHGYMHELYYNKTLAQMREMIERSQNVFSDLTGQVAVGFRGPSGDFQPGSHEMILEMGFEYSSAMRGDDRPYRWVVNGETTDLIEIPAQWELDDFPHFAYNDAPAIIPNGNDRIGGLEWVYDNWRREFDAYRREGLCYTLMMHPQVMGKPARAEVLRRLLAHMQETGDVWFATGRQIANWWRENY